MLAPIAQAPPWEDMETQASSRAMCYAVIIGISQGWDFWCNDVIYDEQYYADKQIS